MDPRNVTFQEDSRQATQRVQKPQTQSAFGNFTSWLVSTKIVKNQAEANYIIFSALILFLAISITMLLISLRPPAGPTPEQQMIFQSMEAHK